MSYKLRYRCNLFNNLMTLKLIEFNLPVGLSFVTNFKVKTISEIKDSKSVLIFLLLSKFVEFLTFFSYFTTKKKN